MRQESQRQNIPEVRLATVTPKKFKIPNFSEICKALNRTDQGVQEYFATKLQCDCTVDQGGLQIKSKVNLQQIRDLVKDYVQQYVVCQNCGSINTTITKAENGKDQVLLCESCKSHRHLKK